jgi:hypothetical protein
MDEIEEEYDEDLLLRKSKLLYPDVDTWVLEMAIRAHINLKGKPFEKDDEEGKALKAKYWDGTSYETN